MKRLRVLLTVVTLVALGLACDSVTPVAPVDGILTISVNPSRIGSDEEAIVTVLARKVDGFPVNEGTEINLTTDVGLIETPVFTNDRGIAESIIKGNGDIGIATINASSGTIDAEPAELQIGSLPFTINLEATPGEISFRNIPQGGHKIKLRATVLDDLAQPLKGVSVLFDTDLGKLESKGEIVMTNLNGVARDTLTVKEGNFSALTGGEFEVSVSTGGDDDLDQTIETITAFEEITVFGFPVDVLLETDQSSIPSTGGQIVLFATVLDELGFPLEGIGVQFETEVGSVASRGALVETDATGQAVDVVSASEQDIQSRDQTINPNSFTVNARAFVGPGDPIAFASDTEEITIQGVAPLPDFTFRSTGCLEVEFTNDTLPASTAEEPIDFEWDFGDGTGSFDENPPPHTYPAAGLYTVTLTATNLFGSLSETKTISVNPRPTASFTFIVAGTVASFTSSTIAGSPAVETAFGTKAYEWTFGDGNGSTQQNPTHDYTAAASGTSPTATLVVTHCIGVIDPAPASVPFSLPVPIP